MSAGEEGVQYNTARTLRHLALGSQPAHKKAALPAVVPLTQALQVSRTPPIIKSSCALTVTDWRGAMHDCRYRFIQTCTAPHTYMALMGEQEGPKFTNSG